MTQKVRAKASVTCRGEVHEILIMEGGALVLRNHPNIEEERALYALSGETLPWCIRILDLWRRLLGDETFPKEMRSSIRRARKTRLERKKLQESQRPDPLMVPREVLFNNRVRHLALSCLARVPFGATAWLDVEVRPDEDPYIMDSWWGNQMRVHVRIRPSWASKVNRRGLAVVNGHFVLDVLEETERGPVVLAGRTMDNGSLRPRFYARRAIVTDDGLHWLD